MAQFRRHQGVGLRHGLSICRFINVIRKPSDIDGNLGKTLETRNVFSKQVAMQNDGDLFHGAHTRRTRHAESAESRALPAPAEMRMP